MGVVIIRELVGTSPNSWSDAARQAVKTASRTVRNIREIEVVKSSARVENGEITEYRVELKLFFEYEGIERQRGWRLGPVWARLGADIHTTR